MNDITTALAGLNDTSAKHREHSIKSLTHEQLQDPSVIEALQKLVSTDPVEYVRDAARAALVSAGQVPESSTAPVQLKEEGVGKPALFGIGVVAAVVVACIALVILVIVVAVVIGGRGS